MCDCGLACNLIPGLIPSGNKTHPPAELEAGHQEFELVVRKPTPDAELGFVSADERREEEEEKERRRKRSRYVDDEAEESDGSE